MKDPESCDLSAKSCVPCRGGVPALKGKDLHPLHSQLRGGWKIIQEHHLSKTYEFSNFIDGLKFVDRVGAVAEQEGHHPDIYLTWGKVRVDIYTHKVDGLTESDFILAAKADKALHEKS